MKDLLVSQLQQIRKETLEAVEPIPDDQLEWAPAHGMRTYSGMLIEIGGTEWITIAKVFNGEPRSWEDADKQFDPSSFDALRIELARIREELLAHLATASDEDLMRPIEVSEVYAEFFGTATPPAHELIRWIAMHEYYHLGQIISYRWAQGFNPYEE